MSQSKMTAGLFTLIAAVALAAVLYMVLGSSGADTVGQSATVANEAPTIASLNTATSSNSAGGATDTASVNLTDNAATTVYFYGIASDNNGCDDINTLSNWNGGVYTSTAGSSCTPDANNCVEIDTTNDGTLLTAVNDCTGASDPDLAFEFTADLEYYADPTDSDGTYWEVGIGVVDDSAATGGLSDTFEVAAGNALTITGGPIAYGSIALGDNSSTSGNDGPQSIAIGNTGNTAIDVAISMPDMTCTSGTLAAAYVEYSLTSVAHGSGTDVTNSAANLDMVLPARTDGAVTDDLFFSLELPASGVSGTCSETMTITAIDAL